MYMLIKARVQCSEETQDTTDEPWHPRQTGRAPSSFLHTLSRGYLPSTAQQCPQSPAVQLVMD